MRFSSLFGSPLEVRPNKRDEPKFIAVIYVILSLSFTLQLASASLNSPVSTIVNDSSHRYENQSKFDPTLEQSSNGSFYKSYEKLRWTRENDEVSTVGRILKPDIDVVTVKQRKMLEYSPSYDIIPDIELGDHSRWSLKAGEVSSMDSHEFKQNLDKLEGIVKRKQKQLRKTKHNEDAKLSNKTLSSRSSESLENDIKTINVLINMLTLANTKLMEQRNILGTKNTTYLTDKQQDDGWTGRRNSEMQLASDLITSKLPASNPTSKQRGVTKRPKAANLVNSSARTNSTTQKTTSSSTATTTLRPNEKSKSKGRKATGGKKVMKKKAEVASEDANLVRPGYSSGRGLGSSEALRRASTVDSERINSSKGQTDLKHSPGGHYPEVFASSPMVQNNGLDLMQQHRPIVAQDLLNMHHHHQQQQHPTGSPHYPYNNRLPVENMFISRHPLQQQQEYQDQSPLYDHFHRQRQILGGSTPIPFGGTTEIPTPTTMQPQANGGKDDVNPEFENTKDPTTPMVPPYNGHSMRDRLPGPITGDPRRRQQHQHQHQQHPTLEALSQQYGEPKTGGVHPIDLFRGVGKPPTYDYNLVPNRHNNLQSPHKTDENEIETHGPFGAHPSPLQQMIMAAKRQQEAALAYERRRLDYEMEMRKREEQMKLQHEDQLKRQQEEQARRDEAGKKQAAKEVAANANSGGSSNEQQNQEQPASVPSGNSESGNEGIGNTSNDSEQNQANNEAQKPGTGEQQQQSLPEEQDSGGGSEQEQHEQQQKQEQQNQKDTDEEMMNFQKEFSADTDFTDLFPPGILSESEIKDMRKQQQEQKQQEEEEQERERQREAESENEGGAEQPEVRQDEQQQQPPRDSQTEQSELAEKSGRVPQATSFLNASSVSYDTSQTSGPLVLSHNNSSNDVTNFAKIKGTNQSEQLNVPAFLLHSLRNLTQLAGAKNQLSGSVQVASNKTRRSHQSEPMASYSQDTGSLSKSPFRSMPSGDSQFGGEHTTTDDPSQMDSWQPLSNKLGGEGKKLESLSSMVPAPSSSRTGHQQESDVQFDDESEIVSDSSEDSEMRWPTF